MYFNSLITQILWPFSPLIILPWIETNILWISVVGESKQSAVHEVSRECDRSHGDAEFLHRRPPPGLGSGPRRHSGVLLHREDPQAVQIDPSLAGSQDPHTYIQGLSQGAHTSRVLLGPGDCCLCFSRLLR